jgi:hypothetical protein
MNSFLRNIRRGWKYLVVASAISYNTQVFEKNYSADEVKGEAGK